MKVLSLIFVTFIVLILSSRLFAQDTAEISSKIDEFISKKQFDEAENYVKNNIKKHNKSSLAKSLLAKICFTRGGVVNRTRALNIYKKAHKLDKKDPLPLHGIADIYMAVKEYKYAIRYLKDILKYNEENIDACRKLLRIYVIKDDVRQIGPAIGAVLNCGELPANTNVPLGSAYLLLKDWEEAEYYLSFVKKDDPDYGPANYYLGKMFYNLGKTVPATEKLIEGLDNLTDKLLLDKFYLTMIDILGEEKKAKYENLPLKEKGKFLAAYWRRLDRDLFKPGNERFLEHMSRIDHAKKAFGMPPPHKFGYDERGRYYIRWGEPEYKLYRNGVVWVYTDFDVDLYLKFSPKGGISEVSRRITNFRMPENYPRVEIALAEAPLERFYTGDRKNIFDMAADIAQFRGMNGKTDILFLHGFNSKMLPEERQDVYPLQKLWMARELNGKVIASETGTATAYLINDSGKRPADYIDAEELSLSPDSVEIVCSLRDNAKTIKSVYTEFINVRNFSSTEFQCSDIIFAGSVGENIPEYVISRENIKIHPHPYKEIIRSGPVYIYFEIYNLGLGQNGNSRYQIEYTLSQTQRAGNLIRQIIDQVRDRNQQPVSVQFERRGKNTYEQEYFSILFSALDKGKYDLEIKITDLHKNTTAVMKKEFVLID